MMWNLVLYTIAFGYVLLIICGFIEKRRIKKLIDKERQKRLQNLDPEVVDGTTLISEIQEATELRPQVVKGQPGDPSAAAMIAYEIQKNDPRDAKDQEALEEEREKYMKEQQDFAIGDLTNSEFT